MQLPWGILLSLLHLGSASAALCLGLKPSALVQSHYFWLSVEVSASVLLEAHELVTFHRDVVRSSVFDKQWALGLNCCRQQTLFFTQFTGFTSAVCFVFLVFLFISGISLHLATAWGRLPPSHSQLSLPPSRLGSSASAVPITACFVAELELSSWALLHRLPPLF